MHHLFRFICAVILTAALTGCDTFREAFREAVANALVHRTWDVPANVTIGIHGEMIGIRQFR